MTRSRPAPSRKDRTHDEIARALGAVAIVIDTHAAPVVGADLLVLSRGTVYFVEVKDGTLPPSRRRLTAIEEARRQDCARAGTRYVIARDVEEAWCALDIVPCRASGVGDRWRCGCGTLDGPARFRAPTAGAKK